MVKEISRVIIPKFPLLPLITLTTQTPRWAAARFTNNLRYFVGKDVSIVTEKAKSPEDRHIPVRTFLNTFETDATVSRGCILSNRLVLAPVTIIRFAAEKCPFSVKIEVKSFIVDPSMDIFKWESTWG